MRRATLILIFLHVTLSGGEVKLPDLQSSDEIIQLRTLWAIAQTGKASKATDTDILPLLTKTWRGKRLSPWCLHALIKMGVPPDKHIAAFLTSARAWENRPDGTKITEAEWRASALGPDLPEDLKVPSVSVWITVLDKLFADFERADEGHIDSYRGIFRELLVPKDLLVPRLASILVDSKKTTSQRNVSALVLGSLGRYSGSVEPLIKGLSDPVAKVRANCTFALVAQGRESTIFGQSSAAAKFEDPEKIFTALVSAAKTDTDKQSRNAAIAALRQVGPHVPTAIPAMIDLAKVQKADRARVLSAMAGFDSPDLIPYFVDCLSDTDVDVQTGAAANLELYARRIKRASLFVSARTELVKLAQETKDSKLKSKAEEALKSINDNR